MGNVILSIPSEWVRYDNKKKMTYFAVSGIAQDHTYGDCNPHQPSWKEFKERFVICNTYDKDGKLTRD